jgi:hypothetical protein
MSSLFGFPHPVNETSARVVAGGVVTMAAATILLDKPAILVPLTYGFAARVLTGAQAESARPAGHPRRHSTHQASRHVLGRTAEAPRSRDGSHHVRHRPGAELRFWSQEGRLRRPWGPDRRCQPGSFFWDLLGL